MAEGGVEKMSLRAIAVEIYRKVEKILLMMEDILDYMKGRFGKDRSHVQLRGTRRAQFMAVVRLKRTRPEVGLLRACAIACRDVKPIGGDPGYTNPRSLYRLANKKRDWFE